MNCEQTRWSFLSDAMSTSSPPWYVLPRHGPYSCTVAITFSCTAVHCDLINYTLNRCRVIHAGNGQYKFAARTLLFAGPGPHCCAHTPPHGAPDVRGTPCTPERRARGQQSPAQRRRPSSGVSRTSFRIASSRAIRFVWTVRTPPCILYDR